MKETLLIASLFASFALWGQSNVGIGTTSPNAQAVLDVESSDKGILISRLTTVARMALGTALTAAEDGMLVYDKDLTSFFFWDGMNLQWSRVGTGASTDNQDLTLTGKILSLTNDPTTVDLGTLEDHDWYEVGGTAPADNVTDDIYTQGNIGLGTATPTERLDVQGSLKLQDGTEGTGKVLTSDQNGKASWLLPGTSVAISGVIPASAYTAALTSGSSIGYTGCYIDLPAGDWEVRFTSWIRPQGTNLLPLGSRQGFTSIFLSTSTATAAPPTYISNIKSIIIPRLYDVNYPGSDTYGTGSIPVNMAAPGRLYLMAFVAPTYYTSLPATANIPTAHFVSLNSLPGSYGPYTQLYAVPVQF